jgi:hypothetical protein
MRLAARLDSCNVFSKLDLRKGYLQVPVAATDVPKMAIITPFSLFEFLRMPFGLHDAGMTFQRLMDSLLGHLAVMFSLLQDNSLVVNVNKCTLVFLQWSFWVIP